MFKRKLKTRPLQAHSIDNDPTLVQAVVNRRLALRLGVSLPVAAVVAALAGLGPQEGHQR